MTATRNRGAGGVAAHAGGVSRTAKTRSETMRVGLLGRKVGMTQIFQEDGTSVPVTVLECGPCTVLQVRTEERDGYHAVQLGFDDKKRKSATQPERGHAKKVDAEPKRYIREIRQEQAVDVAEGQKLTVEVFDALLRAMRDAESDEKRKAKV